MNWRKHIVLIVGGGIAVLLLIGATVFLTRSMGKYNQVKSDLDQGMQRLETLTRRDPYPSAANIKQVDANLGTLKEAASVLQDTILRGQVRPESIEIAEFAPMLERTSKRLAKRAADAGITLPVPFSLGMARYSAGELPSPEALPRLVIQLKSMEAIGQILLQSHISSLLSIERQEFESGAQSQGEEQPTMRRRQAAQDTQAPTLLSAIPMPASNTLYEVERFRVVFQARDVNVWEALNQLAKAPLLVSVVDVQLQNTAADLIGKATPLTPIGGEQAAAAASALSLQARYPTHEERVVAGRELIQVTLVLDVYRLVREIKEDAP